MEYQKIANLLDNNLSNQPSKFSTKNWVEINDESKESYGANSDIRFKITMLRSNLCDYADAYILVKGTTTITGNAGPPFTKYISRINGTDTDNAQDIDIVIPMYKLIEYCDNYSKTSGSLWQSYKDDSNNNLIRSESFKSKIKITGKTSNDGNTKVVQIMVPLKYLSKFWGTLEMPLINR